MAKARDEILTEYTGDTRSFQRAARIYDRTLGRQERLTNERLTRMDRRHERSSRAILNTTTALSGIGAALAVGQVRAYAEAWRSVERSLAAIGYKSEGAKKSVVDLALRTRASVNATADAVQRMTKSTGADLETSVRRVETLQKLLAFGGASGGERNSVSLQLGQALKSGQLSGDEFRSISENAPVEFLDALAAAAGIARKDLKAFAQEQRLTTDIVLAALDSLATEADAKFKSLAVSGEEALDVLETGLKSYVGTLDSSLGATATFNGLMVHLGTYLSENGEGAKTLASAIQVLGGAAVAVAGSRGVGALNASFQKAAASRRVALEVAREQSALHRQEVIDARQKVALSQEVRRARQRDHEQRVFSGQAAKRSGQQLTAAIASERKALDVLSGAQVRAQAGANALAAAQARLSLATRISTASMRTLNSVMAFFGGPIGLAITAITVTLSIMATRVSAVDRHTESVTGHVTEMAAEFARANGSAEGLREKLAEASVPRAIADVQALQGELDTARKKASRIFDSRRDRRIVYGFPELAELGDLMISGSIKADQFRERLNAMTIGADEKFVTAANHLETLVSKIIDAEESSDRANDVLAILTGTSEEAAAAIQRLGIDMGGAAQTADTLGQSASAAAQGISSLVSMIPELNAAAQTQEKVTKAVEARDAALAGLGDRSLWGGREVAQADKINGLFQRAIGEIDGTAAATRKANSELEKYTSDAHLSSLDVRNQALAREKQRYEGVVKSLEAASAGQEKLAAAQVAYEQRVATINGQHDKKSGSAGAKAIKDAERHLSAARELLVENGHRALYIEQALLAEREKLVALMPQLIEMGLSRAEAEAAVESQLGRVEVKLNEVRSASEEAAHSFARGVLEDIAHADSLSDALGGIAKRLQNLATDRAFDALADQFARLATGGSAGGSGGGFLSTFFGSLFGSGGGASTSKGAASVSVAGKRAKGGPAVGGLPYLVNEDTPNSEIFVPSSSGAVLNVAQAQAALQGTAQAANVSVSVAGPQINIINNAKDVSVREERSGAGRVDILIEKQFDAAVRGGRLDAAMSSRFGVRPRPKGA